MKKFILGVFLVAPVLALVALGAEQGKEARQVVFVPQDNTHFKVGLNQMVRLTGEGISGAKIVVNVDGPAKVVAENSVLTVKDGHILIGKENVEFAIKPTGLGTVKVKITSTFLKNEPTVTNYEFEVK